MLTFDKTNKIESDKKLLKDISAKDEDERKIQNEVEEDIIIELEGKMKSQILVLTLRHI